MQLLFDQSLYAGRRQKLIRQLDSGLVLLLGNEESPINYTDNVYPFRQDSNFLYFCGIDRPHVAAIIDIDEGTTTLFGDDVSVEMIVWTGPQGTLSSLAQKTGIEKVASYDSLSQQIANAGAKGRNIHYLPPYRADNTIKLHRWLQLGLEEVQNKASVKLIRAVVAQASIKSPEEIVELERAVNITRAMHVAVMQEAGPGKIEAELAGIAKGIAIGGGGDLAYSVILTVNGQTLHNHDHSNTLKEGQLVLGDFGAETAMHYAGDITRTFPVSRKFTNQQKDIYNIVLDAQVKAIQALQPGIPYKDIHLQACTIITEGLSSLGLMKGDPKAAVAAGAHALFMPHGLGHMIGLDVHDMEDLGEDYVGYDEKIQRSSQFGLKSLRLGRALQAGFVITVEPGIYFIPELIDQWQAEGKFKDFINYSALKAYRNFSGVRIEDNVLITDNGHRILGEPIPKTVEEVEGVRE